MAGVHHWTAHHPLGRRSTRTRSSPLGRSSIRCSRGRRRCIGGLATPQQAILTNRRHVRQSDRLRDALRCVVRAPAPASAGRARRAAVPVRRRGGARDHGGGDRRAVRGRDRAGHRTGPGALVFGDGLVRRGGVLGYPADADLGAHPLRKKEGLEGTPSRACSCVASTRCSSLSASPCSRAARPRCAGSSKSRSSAPSTAPTPEWRPAVATPGGLENRPLRARPQAPSSSARSASNGISAPWGTTRTGHAASARTRRVTPPVSVAGRGP
jgi:hypothetical protein